MKKIIWKATMTKEIRAVLRTSVTAVVIGEELEESLCVVEKE